MKIFQIKETTMFKIMFMLLCLNYMIVTIVFHDVFYLKFLRDILLVIMLLICIYKKFWKDKDKINEIYKNPLVTLMFIIILFLLLAVIKTSDHRMILVFLRKYLFPLSLLYIAAFCENKQEVNYNGVLKFIFRFIGILSGWGIFQAYILKDKFLMMLGYPTMHSYALDMETLKSSYYFGNLGIQRVVATLSNSNVYALILGVVLIIIIFNFNFYIKNKLDYVNLSVMVAAYILTFSRTNFLAFIIVAVILSFRYIPYKKILGLIITGITIILTILYFIQGKDSILHKLVNWVYLSLSFSESSVAGRTGLWKAGLEAVIANPFGIGFGKVGSIAQDAGASLFYHCENSYLAIALDLGCIGLIIYIAFISYLFVQLWKGRNDNLFSKSALRVLLYFVIACFFSNHIYDMEAVAIVFIFIGWALNRHIIIGESS